MASGKYGLLSRLVCVVVSLAIGRALGACGRSGYDITVRRSNVMAGDVDGATNTLTIDDPGEGVAVASYRRFAGRCRSGVSVRALPGPEVSAPASVTCDEGQFRLPVSFSGTSGPRVLSVEQVTDAEPPASATRTVQLTLQGMNQPRGFDRPPRLLLENPLDPTQIYVIGASLYDNRRLFGLVRLNAAFVPDPDFAFPGDVGGGDAGFLFMGNVPPIIAGDIEPTTGKLYIAGNIESIGDTPVNDVVRLNPDGTLDASFDVGTGFAAAAATTAFVAAVRFDPSTGSLYAIGRFDTVDGVPSPTLVRLHADGAVDTTFSVGTGFERLTDVKAILLDSQGRLVIAGSFAAYNGVTRPAVVRLLGDGSIDLSFDPSDGPSCCGPYVAALEPTTDAVYVGGNFETFAGVARPRLVRLSTDGTVDLTFDTTGSDVVANALDVAADGSITVCGSGVQRFTSSGLPDSSWTAGTLSRGACHSLLVRSTIVYLGIDGWGYTHYDGRVRDEVMWVSPFGGDTALHAPRAVGFDHVIQQILWDPGLEMLVAIGPFARWARDGSHLGVALGHIARITREGVLDETFNPGGTGFDNVPETVAQTADGKYLVGGPVNTYNGAAVSKLVRLERDGTHDSSFVLDSAVDLWPTIVLVDDSGRIVLGGRNWVHGTVHGVARVTADGLRDTTFDVGAGLGSDPFARVWALAWDATRRQLYVGGEFEAFNGMACSGLVRLNEDGAVDPSFTPPESIGVKALHWDGALDRLLVQSYGFANLGVVDPNGVRESFVLGAYDGFCYDPDLRRVYRHDLVGTVFSALAVPELREVPDFVSGEGPSTWITACAVDPTTHEVFMTSDFGLTAYDVNTLHGLARVAADGSLVP